MLVGSLPGDEVEKCLLSAGYEVTPVHDGEAAISQAQRAAFSMAVLLSTGKAMDLAETVFNLRDVNPSMQIIIITDREGIEKSAPAEIIARTSLSIRVLSVDGLAAYFGVTRSSAKARLIGRRH